jgi:hypothetical protein
MEARLVQGIELAARCFPRLLVASLRWRDIESHLTESSVIIGIDVVVLRLCNGARRLSESVFWMKRTYQKQATQFT